jgi:tetratricopeptide (TPR) repeat protein
MKKLLIAALTALLFVGCTDKKTAVENFNSGIEKYNAKEYSSALTELSKSVIKDSHNTNAFYFKGLCEVQLKNDSAALISFQNAIAIDSSNFQALVERAKLKISLGDYVSAINDCDNSRMFKLDYSELYKTKASAYEFLNDASNAIIAYESAIKYGQSDGETYYKLAKLKLSYGNHDEACSLLSKAGELGFMDAFKLIKSNCNQSGINNNTTPIKNNRKIIGQYKSYPNRFSITFPSDWQVDEISNSDKTVMTVSASKEGHFLSVLEIDPKLTDFNFHAKSIYEVDKEEFISDMRNRHSDFDLMDFKKEKINDIDAYYYKVFSSFNSRTTGKLLSGITIMCVVLNSKTQKIYAMQGNAEKSDVSIYEPIYVQTFNTFNFE